MEREEADRRAVIEMLVMLGCDPALRSCVNPEGANGQTMNTEQSSKVAKAEVDLNNTLVNADITEGYEEYLALFDHFYDENVEVASDSNTDPLVGKARVLSIILNFLMPLHVMAEIGGLSVRLRYTPLFSDKREEQHADWSLDLVGATGRSIMVNWSSTRRWRDGRVIYERHSDHRQFGEALTMIDLDFGPGGMGAKPRIHVVV
jgi:hypothetical protein